MTKTAAVWKILDKLESKVFSSTTSILYSCTNILFNNSYWSFNPKDNACIASLKIFCPNTLFQNIFAKRPIGTFGARIIPVLSWHSRHSILCFKMTEICLHSCFLKNTLFQDPLASLALNTMEDRAYNKALHTDKENSPNILTPPESQHHHRLI